MNEYTKDFFASKTTWGVLMLLVSPALRMAGIEIDEQGVVDTVTMIAGALVVVWGQFTRTKEITSVAGIKVKP